MICPDCGTDFVQPHGKPGARQIYCRNEDCQRKRRTRHQTEKRFKEGGPMVNPRRPVPVTLAAVSLPVCPASNPPFAALLQFQERRIL